MIGKVLIERNSWAEEVPPPSSTMSDAHLFVAPFKWLTSFPGGPGRPGEPGIPTAPGLPLSPLHPWSGNPSHQGVLVHLSLQESLVPQVHPDPHVLGEFQFWTDEAFWRGGKTSFRNIHKFSCTEISPWITINLNDWDLQTFHQVQLHLTRTLPDSPELTPNCRLLFLFYS